MKLTPPETNSFVFFHPSIPCQTITTGWELTANAISMTRWTKEDSLDFLSFFFLHFWHSRLAWFLHRSRSCLAVIFTQSPLCLYTPHLSLCLASSPYLPISPRILWACSVCSSFLPLYGVLSRKVTGDVKSEQTREREPVWSVGVSGTVWWEILSHLKCPEH